MSSESKYYIHAVLLDDCSYSNKALELLQSNGIKNKIQRVNNKNKRKFKLSNYDTYPQIFLKKEESFDSLLLGGYSDLNEFINIFKHTKYNDEIINKFQVKYNWWSKKAILRLIQLINKKI